MKGVWKKFVSSVLSVALAYFSLHSVAGFPEQARAAVGFSSGNGSANQPYVITTAEQLAYLADMSEANVTASVYFELGSDIDLEEWIGENGWEPIGTEDDRFNGIFDGNGYAISNLKVEAPSLDYIGLFGATDSGSVIRNVRLIDVDIDGRIHVGALVGSNYGAVENSSSSGPVTGELHVGGLVGTNEGTMNRGRASGQVEGQMYVGGLIGRNGEAFHANPAVTNSCATGNVQATNNFVGGLIGYNMGIVDNSCASGAVEGDYNVGGLIGTSSGSVSRSHAGGNVVGHNEYSGGLIGFNEGTVEKSYANGIVSNYGSRAGGLVGSNYDGAIIGSYASGYVLGISHYGGLVGHNVFNGTVSNSYALDQTAEAIGTNENPANAVAHSRTLSELSNSDTYDASWDFERDWYSTGVDVPRLRSLISATVMAEKDMPSTNEDNMITLTMMNESGVSNTGFNGNVAVMISGVEASEYGAMYGRFGWTTLTDEAETGQEVFASFMDGEAKVSLILHGAGEQKIRFKIGDGHPLETNELTITPVAGPAAEMILTRDIQPPVKNGELFAQQPVLTLLDAYGNKAEGDNSTSVTASKWNFGDWTLAGTTVRRAVYGVVEFDDLAAVNETEIVNAFLLFNAPGLNQLASGSVTLPWPTPSAPTLVDAVAGDRQVTLSWTEVEGSVSYAVYGRTGSAPFDVVLQTVDGSELDATVTGLANGTAYHFAVKALRGGEWSGLSNELTATPQPPAPEAPPNVSVSAGDGEATIHWDAVSGATGYKIFMRTGDEGYDYTEPAGTVPGTSASYTATGLTNGATYYFVVKASNGGGDSPDSAEVSATPTDTAGPGSGNGNGGDGDSDDDDGTYRIPTTPKPAATPSAQLAVSVNGRQINAGAVTSTDNNGTIATVAKLDEGVMEQTLASSDDEAVVAIAVTGEGEEAIAEWSGRMMKLLSQKRTILELRTDSAVYRVPADWIDLDAVQSDLGKSLTDDIVIRMKIGKPTQSTVRQAESAAANGGYTIVVPAVDFAIEAVDGQRKADVKRFKGCAVKLIALPEEGAASRATAGIAIDPGGSVRPVPMRVVSLGEETYAQLHSLTNSAYVIVSHSATFPDMAGHWAEETVHDLASRLVIEGVGDDAYDPDREMTRAEFSAMIVRGLGLAAEDGDARFADVEPADWHYAAVQTAYAYGLTSGFEDGTFRPEEKITREQAAVIMAKAMELYRLTEKLSQQASNGSPDGFADASDISEWAKPFISAGLQGGLITGRSGTELAPQAFVTRAEAAELIRKLLRQSGFI